MGKKLVIIESPGKIEKISSLLGDDYTVIASVGHITELAKGGHHGIGVDIENQFKPKYVLMQDKVKVLNNILNEAKTHDSIILLCDPDREGISIAWHIKQKLSGIDKDIKSTTTDKLTKEGLKKAFENLGDININVVRAQEARRVLDRIVGFVASPYLINTQKSNLSAGRVQSVTVRLIVDKEREIEAFVPETFYTIDLTLKKDTEFKAVYPKKLRDKKEADRIYNILKDDSFIVSDIIDDFEYKAPSAPMITSTLQQTMSNLHGFDADRTMKAAQSLYEGGYVTYIRTDCPDISEEALTDVRDYLKNNNYKIPAKPNKYKSKESAQEAHECIRPTYLNNDLTSSFCNVDEDQKKVYDVIWKYFVASQALPAKYSIRKVSFQSKKDNSIVIKSSGKCLVEANFLDILQVQDNSKIEIPFLSLNEEINLANPNSVILEKKKTQAPARYNLSKLLKELENRGIGRPSTYADLLSKIESRNYVEKKGNVYYPTDLGKKITDLLTENFSFMDYEFTAKVEEELDQIAAGKVTYLEMMERFYPLFSSEIKKAYKKSNLPLCTKCDSPLVASKDGSSTFCSNYKKCK
jgi:DNA topoisomerase-1